MCTKHVVSNQMWPFYAPTPSSILVSLLQAAKYGSRTGTNKKRCTQCSCKRGRGGDEGEKRMKMTRSNAEKDYCVKIFTISKNKKTKYLYCKKTNIALIMGERGFARYICSGQVIFFLENQTSESIFDPIQFSSHLGHF